jgi:GTP pyrophosphokinase
MVSVRKTHQLSQTVEEWFNTLNWDSETDKTELQQLYYEVTQIADEEEALLFRGREMLEILLSLGMDAESLKAGLLYPFVQSDKTDIEKLRPLYSESLISLLESAKQMEAIRTLYRKGNDSNVDKIRRMLLAMVEDVRAVVIKLAETVCTLREAKNIDEESRVLLAREAASIYAPLANRLGIGQIKWEIEDLSFRYQWPEQYKRIAKLLDEKRLDREDYIEEFVEHLQEFLDGDNIKAKVYGRPKHIYSIYRKMQRKQLDFQDLFDIRAVRIICNELRDCYGALGVVHTQWKHLPKEFDDYIANPKENGYQSIHTVVFGPKGKMVEIQIRTAAMHDDAELGVAAHWKYKEGEQAAQGGYEAKINWLRKILAWQEEVSDSGDIREELQNQVFEDRVYVFTPRGDVVDLPEGSTPLDFAYYVHSNVGHRCVGAKVFNRIVPFTYKLQTGDQIEILTAKEPNPSRDWLNPNLGYVNSSRARSKILTWFKKQDREKNIVAGKELLEQDLKRMGLNMSDVESVIKRFNVNSLDDLLAAVGGGDIRLNQLLNSLQSQVQKEQDKDEIDPRLLQRSSNNKKPSSDAIIVDGVGNLMTSMAGCCHPVPGDDIVGYITVGRGISVHRSNCEQLHALLNDNPERTVEVAWGEKAGSGYKVNVHIQAQDRTGLLRDITTLLANERVSVMGMKTHTDYKTLTAYIDLEMELLNLDSLSKVLSKLSQMNDVISVERT